MAAQAPSASAASVEIAETSPPDAGPLPAAKDTYVVRLRAPSSNPSSPPVVRVAPPTIGPSIPPAFVRAVVHRRAGQRLHRCYETAIAKNPTLAGRLRVAFTIGPSGDVPSASIEPPGLDKDLDACVVAEVLRLQFPAPPGGGKVLVMFPMEFRPS